MYFWRTRALAGDLRAGIVSERQRMWYLLAHTVLISSGMFVNLECRESRHPYESFEWAAFAPINAAGVLLCYDANRRGDDREFVSRFICLGWPTTIRLVMAALLLLLMAYFAMRLWDSWQGRGPHFRAEPLALAVGFGFSLLYYWRLRAHVRWVAAGPIP